MHFVGVRFVGILIVLIHRYPIAYRMRLALRHENFVAEEAVASRIRKHTLSGFRTIDTEFDIGNLGLF